MKIPVLFGVTVPLFSFSFFPFRFSTRFWFILELQIRRLENIRYPAFFMFMNSIAVHGTRIRGVHAYIHIQEPEGSGDGRWRSSWKDMWYFFFSGLQSVRFWVPVGVLAEGEATARQIHLAHGEKSPLPQNSAADPLQNHRTWESTWRTPHMGMKFERSTISFILDGLRMCAPAIKGFRLTAYFLERRAAPLDSIDRWTGDVFFQRAKKTSCRRAKWQTDCISSA